MTIQYELIKRTIAGEHFLVPVGEGAQRFKGMFALNELGAFLWDHIPQANNGEELVELVLQEYEVDWSTAEKDTEEFLSSLRELGILE